MFSLKKKFWTSISDPDLAFWQLKPANPNNQPKQQWGIDNIPR
jgi:hypothetical protein